MFTLSATLVLTSAAFLLPAVKGVRNAYRRSSEGGVNSTSLSIEQARHGRLAEHRAAQHSCDFVANLIVCCAKIRAHGGSAHHPQI
jgi:hypothetical protein